MSKAAVFLVCGLFYLGTVPGSVIAEGWMCGRGNQGSHGALHRECCLCSYMFGDVAFHHPEQRLPAGPSHIQPFPRQSECSPAVLLCGCSAVSFSLCVLILEGSALTNGGLNLHSPVKRKLEAEKDYVFDKRLRYSVRQNESNCRFRDIVVRKEEGFTHILLSSQTSDNNALTPEVRGMGWRVGAGSLSPPESVETTHPQADLTWGPNLLISLHPSSV